MSTVTFTWSLSSTPLSEIASQQISYSINGANSVRTVTAETTSSVFTNVPEGAIFTAKVRSLGTNGAVSEYSDEVSITVPTSTPPAAPTLPSLTVS